MKRGEYQSKICPYGYRKGPDGRMEPDEETAPVVQMIYELAKAGHSTTQIARVLLEKGIQTPGERKAAMGIVKTRRFPERWPLADLYTPSYPDG